MKLTADEVDRVVSACLEKLGTPKTMLVEGIVNIYSFDEEKINEHSEEIRELLMELPDNFREKSGGGWSFLRACQDRHGNQWTGLHMLMEGLMCLGIAAGHVKFVMPRNMWNVLPGGMPYFMIKEKKSQCPSTKEEGQ